MQMGTMRHPERYGMSKEEQSSPPSHTHSLARKGRCVLISLLQPRSTSSKCTTRRQELRTLMSTTACQLPRLHNHLRTRTPTMAGQPSRLHNQLRRCTRTLACHWPRLRLHLDPLPKPTVHLAGVAPAVALVRGGQESAGSSSSSWPLSRLSWSWPWSSPSQYTMPRTDRDMLDESMKRKHFRGWGCVLREDRKRKQMSRAASTFQQSESSNAAILDRSWHLPWVRLQRRDLLSMLL